MKTARDKRSDSRPGMMLAASLDAVYGAFFDRGVIPRGGKDAVKRSVERYIGIIEGGGTGEQR